MIAIPKTEAQWLTGPPGYPPQTQVPLMRPEGNGLLGVLAIGEALGEKEENDRLPFRPYAEAGSILERALYRAGTSRDALTLTNLVWYRPPRNWLDGAPWEQDAIRMCKPFNDALVRERQPKAILALGGMAMRELTGLSGEKCGIGMTRGFCIPSVQYKGADGHPIPVVGAFHPSFLRRGAKERQQSGPRSKVEAAGGGTQGMALLGVLIRDILYAVQVAREGAKAFVPKPHFLGATLVMWQALLEDTRKHPERVIFYDFETLDSIVASDESEFEITRRDVTQAQVCVGGQVLVSNWFAELWPVLRSLIELPNPKADWNGRMFDRPILRDMAIRADIGEWHDVMDFWHHAQPDLARGLQYAASFVVPEVGPWKHLSASDPFWYGLLDVDILERIFSALQLSLSLTRHPISNVSLFEGYQDQVVAVAPVLDRMKVRGIPVDEGRRLALDEEFTTTLMRISGECQALFPDALRSCSPRNGFVRMPKDLLIDCFECAGTGKVLREITRKNGKLAQKKVLCSACAGAKTFPIEGTPEGWAEREFEDLLKCDCWWSLPSKRKPMPSLSGDVAHCEKCSNTGKRVQTVRRWARLEPFLPGSWQQVLRYLEHKRAEDVARMAEDYARHHPAMAQIAQSWASAKSEWKIPLDYQTGRPTTAADELERLQRHVKDPLLPLILQYKEIEKARGTYVRGWAPGPDGRVHPNFGFKPATPQLSSSEPCAQNFPTHAELSHSMKQMIRAPGGKRFVKFDWKSFFIITGGFEAQDEQFIRIGRVDMHSFVTLVGLLRLERPEVAFAWQDGELKDRLQWWRSQAQVYREYARPGFAGGMTFAQIRDYIAKRVIFAWQNGQGARSLWHLWQETFKDIAEAAAGQKVLAELFPKTPEWQTAVRLKADADHELITRFGHVRRFWDVYHRKPVQDNYQPWGSERIWVQPKTGTRWLLSPGTDHEAVTAYLPNANAYGIKRACLRELGRLGWDERYGLLADVHDALYFETERVESLVADVKPLLEAPCALLTDPVVASGGLWCATECAVGPDWDSWTKIA